MKLSILIINWNSKDFVRDCIRSIHETCSELEPQIVVVDGASFDGCGEMLKREFPEVVFIQSQDNIGFGRANNLGFQQVTGEALLLLNPDTILFPGAVATLMAELGRLSDVGLLGPKLLNSDGTLQTTCARALPTALNQALSSEFLQGLFPRSKLWGNWNAFRSAQSTEVEALSGACMLLRSELFQRMGGFSPEFFMYGEDLDLCFKTRALGLKNYYVPPSVVTHHGGQSSGQQFKKFSVVLMREADHLLLRKWRGRFHAGLYRLLMGGSALVRIVLLLPGATVGTVGRRAVRRNSLLKWRAILSWCLGGERWTAEYAAPRRESLHRSEAVSAS